MRGSGIRGRKRKYIPAAQGPKRAALEPALARDAKHEIHRALNVAAAEELAAGMSVQRVLPALEPTSVEAVVGAGGGESDGLRYVSGRVGHVLW